MGGGLAEASYARDTPLGLWAIGWVAIETWCGMELCVVCAGENELMWSREDQGGDSSFRVQVPGGGLGGRGDGSVLQPQEVTVCAPPGLLSH